MSGAPPPVQLTPPPRPDSRPRRNRMLLAAGVLAVCLGALGAATLYLRATHTQQVVRVTRDVQRGQTLTAADLSVISLPDTPGLTTVPASRMTSLIGQLAAADLTAGTLFTPTDVGTPDVAAGTVVVGLRLEAGRFPRTGLGSGSPVTLVAVPGTAAAIDKPDATFRGVVMGTPQRADDGGWLVDVGVANADAHRIARLGAVGQLALIREAGR